MIIKNSANSFVQDIKFYCLDIKIQNSLEQENLLSTDKRDVFLYRSTRQEHSIIPWQNQ